MRSGLLTRSTDGYRGGAGLIDRGQRAAAQDPLRSLALPELTELQQRTATAVWFVDIRDDDEWVVVASLYGKAAASSRYRDDWPHSPRDPSMLASALGQLALSSRPVAAASLLSKGVPRLTPQTEVEPGRVEAALERAGTAGEVVEHGGFLRGWSCLAVPLLDVRTQRMVAVLGIADRTPRFATSRLLSAAHSAAASLQRAWARETRS